MAHRQAVIAAVVAASFVSGACATGHRPFRTSTLPVETTQALLRDPARRAAVAATSLEKHETFTLAVVEFDDQGQYWDRRQVDALEAEVVQEAGGSDDPGVLMPVFVHGWRHGADVCDTHLACFRELLRKIARDQKDAIALVGSEIRPPRVVGVYVGWRGLSKKVWPLEQLSFVARKNAALRVGGGDMAELLTRLDHLRRELNVPGKDPSRLVILGHSLGGTVVYAALANIFKNRLAEAWPGIDVEGGSRVIRGFGDLVVLVNPAFEAEAYRPIFELSTTYAGFSKRQRPVLIVVGSETDSATRAWFPVGQAVATLFERTRGPEQGRALRTAIGNYEPYATHRLSLVNTPAGGGERAPEPTTKDCVCELPRAPMSAEDMREVVARFRQSSSTAGDSGEDRGGPSWGAEPCEPERIYGEARLACIKPLRRGDPFWVVRAAPEILHEHAGFFNPAFTDFLRRVLLETMAASSRSEDVSPRN